MRKAAYVAVTVVIVLSVATALAYMSVPYPKRGWEKNASGWLALTTALYWESGLAESREGIHAIAWVIFNRKDSKDFPDTIRGVVTEGARGQINGCQFSFACDGEIEMPERLCELHPLSTEHLGIQCGRRWLYYAALAGWWLYVRRGDDPTNGAVLYYTGPEPYWTADLEPGSVQIIGSHYFGRSKWLGRDIAASRSAD